MSAENAAGVIHDIGYQRYTGPRLGRRYARRSLYTHSLRAAFGLGRSAKAKVFPWAVISLITLVALIITAIRTQSGEEVMAYSEFPEANILLLVLLCAVMAPEMVSRDLRGGVLPLYFARPLTRPDYALGKLAALVSAVFLALAGPLTLMVLGGAFAVKQPSQVATEFGHYGQGLISALVYALIFGSLSLLVASLAGRRTVAAAMIVAVFLVTTPVYGVLYALSGEDTTGAYLAGLVSPMTLAVGVMDWWFDGGGDVGAYGAAYGLTAAALVAASTGLLLLRYRKVAR
jgi:ABC-2 type transport system permease protein